MHKELYKSPKHLYLLLSLIDHMRIYLCNESCSSYSNSDIPLRFFNKILKSIDININTCFTEYLLEKNNFEELEIESPLDSDITRIISLIRCNKCRYIYNSFINKKSFNLYLCDYSKKYKYYLKDFFNTINACIYAFENNNLNLQNVYKYIKKISQDNKMILNGHDIYVSESNIYHIKDILIKLYYPIFSVLLIDDPIVFIIRIRPYLGLINI